MEYSEILVKRIRTECKKRKLSIRKLAKMSGSRQSTLDNIVRGITKNPQIITLHKVANAFSMTLSEFLDIEELNNFSFDDYDEEQGL